MQFFLTLILLFVHQVEKVMANVGLSFELRHSNTICACFYYKSTLE
jgi:hypothetical protein